MNNNLLLIIDLQNAFINQYTMKSKEDISRLLKREEYNNVLFTRFLNSESSPVYQKLKWGSCIDAESTKICIDTNGYDILDKTTYTALNDDMREYITEKQINTIHLCGIDVECCVLVTALNMFENNYDVRVLEDYVYCMHGEKAKANAIKILERNIGKRNIITKKKPSR